MTKVITLNTTIECVMSMEVGNVLCVESSIGDSYGTITMISYVTLYMDVEPSRSDHNPIKML